MNEPEKRCAKCGTYFVGKGDCCSACMGSRENVDLSGYPPPYYSIENAPKTSPAWYVLPAAIIIASLVCFMNGDELIGAGIIGSIIAIYILAYLIGAVKRTAALKDNGEPINGYRKIVDRAADTVRYIHPYEPALPVSSQNYDGLFIRFTSTGEQPERYVISLMFAHQYGGTGSAQSIGWLYIHELIIKTDQNIYHIAVDPKRNADEKVTVESDSDQRVRDVKVERKYIETDTIHISQKMFVDMAVSSNLLISYRGKGAYSERTFNSYVRRRGIIDAYCIYRKNPEQFCFKDDVYKGTHERIQSTEERQAAAVKELYDLVLTSSGNDIMSIVKVLMALLNIGLPAAMEMAKQTPSIIRQGVPKEDASGISEQLIKAGAEVEIMPHTE